MRESVATISDAKIMEAFNATNISTDRIGTLEHNELREIRRNLPIPGDREFLCLDWIHSRLVHLADATSAEAELGRTEELVRVAPELEGEAFQAYWAAHVIMSRIAECSAADWTSQNLAEARKRLADMHIHAPDDLEELRGVFVEMQEDFQEYSNQLAESPVDDDAVIPDSCEGCGACCLEQLSPPMYVPILCDDLDYDDTKEDVIRARALPQELQQELRDYWDLMDTGEEHPRDEVCLWFDETTRKCKHYELRPSICREFPFGEEGCLGWRKKYAIQS